MIIDIFSQRRKAEKDISFAREIGKVNREIKAAKDRFNAAEDSLEIEAAIFRLNELEAVRKNLIIKAKLQKIKA